MSNGFKEKLLSQLVNIVLNHFEVTKLIYNEFTETGFFCDFDMPVPLNPGNFEEIKHEVSSLDSECFFELPSFSGVYQDGDSNKKMLQRIYVTAFENEKDFKAHKEYIQLSSEHEHKKIGAQMGLFSSSDEIGAGLILWHPNGAMIRYLLEQFGQKAHIINGYQWVYTPHIGKSKLWETSGHLEFYKDSMYNPIQIDDEQYYLKPMNCPFHINIYNSEKHSYRDLPLRMAEYGTVYRYELSGTLNGLTRVRGFTQDDAHIICTPQQIESEVTNALKFSLYVLGSFGLDIFKIYVSTKPKQKFIGSDDDWNVSTDVLKKAVGNLGMEYDIDEGGGAFYGPKIDIKLNDLLNREWQCSTIQFDFNLPKRFNMSYTGSDGKEHTPYMIHRALFGSIERFAALLIEHYKGDFPLWIAPVQFAVVPIKQSHNDYCKKLETEFKRHGLRIVTEYEDINMREKIKRFEKDKIPYIFVVGDRDIQNNAFSVRSRKHGDLGAMNIEQLLEHVKPELDKGVPKYILEE